MASYGQGLPFGGSLKIVVVGDGAVGKTSLLYRYARNEFPEVYVPTVFDNYSAQVAIDGKAVTMTIWDTAGQEDYDRIRPLSYPGTDVFILCFSTCRPASLANVRNKWLRELRHHSPLSKIILVGTQTDLREDPTVLHDLARKLEKPITSDRGQELVSEGLVQSYHECSARTGENVQQVFQATIRSCVVKKVLKHKGERGCTMF